MRNVSCQLLVFSCQIKKISVILLSAGLIFISGGCSRREITNINSNGNKIICFGDSITAGYGVNPGEDYPSLLAKLITIPVINAGNSGETSREAIARLESEVLNKNPLLVIVEFGGNDFLKKLPLEQSIKNIEEIIKRIQAGNAMVAIADISNSMIMGEYRRALQRLSRKYNTIFIPKLLSGILTNPSLKSDFIHPNAEGYKIIAQRISRTIKPYLKRNIALKK